MLNALSRFDPDAPTGASTHGTGRPGLRGSRVRGKPRLPGLSASLLGAATLLASYVAPAHADLTTVGPVNPATGFPAWLQDANVRLQPCLANTSLTAAGPCFGPGALFPGLDTVLPNPGAPPSVPDNFVSMPRYWQANATAGTTTGGIASLELATLGAFVPDLVVTPDKQALFHLMHFRVTRLTPGETYTITHPYGVDTFVANAAEPGIDATITAGCLAAPCDAFDAVRTTRIGPWLTWDPAVAPAAPAGFIGDFATRHAVTGSPFGTNFFEVKDASGAIIARTDQFQVQGKLFGPTVTASVPGGLYNAPQSVTLSADDGSAKIFFTLDGTEPTTASQRFGGAIDIATTTTLKFIGVTGAGDQSAVRTEVYTIDAVAPTASIVLPAVPAGATVGNYRGPVTVDISAADTGGAGLSALEYSLDNGATWLAVPGSISAARAPARTAAAAARTANATAVNTSSGTVTFSADGSYSVLVRATDLAGNVFVTPAASFVIDTALPTATITLTGTQGTGANFRSAVDATIAASDANLSTVEYSLDNGATWTPVPVDNKVVVSGEGSHTVQARATDKAGNISALASQTFMIDLTAPTVSITLPPVPTAGVYESAVDAVIAGADNLGGSDIGTLQYQLDTGAMTAVPVNGIVSVSADGSHIISAQVADKAGNLSEVASKSFVIDTAAPTVSIALPAVATGATAGNYPGPVAASIAATKINVATLEYSLDNGATWTPVPADNKVLIIGEGGHSLQARGTDLAGNVVQSQVVSFVIDITAPTATITLPPDADGLYNSAQSPVSVAIAGADEGTGISALQFSLDGAPMTPVPAGGVVSVSSDGSHTITVQAMDKAGNPSAVASKNFAIDTVAPVVSVSRPGGLYNGAQAVSLTVDDPLASLLYTLDGSEPNAAAQPPVGIQFLPGVTGPISIPAPDQAGILTTTLKVLATDPAGNSTIRTTVYQIETSGSLAVSPPAGLYNAPQLVTLTADDPAAVIWFTTDGTDPNPGALPPVGTRLVSRSPINIAATTILKAVAVDASGKQSPVVTAQYVIDTLAPTATIALSGTQALLANVGPYRGPVSATITGNDNAGGSGIGMLEFKLDAADWTPVPAAGMVSVTGEGSHILQARATDKAGNVSALASETFVIETVTQVMNPEPAPSAGGGNQGGSSAPAPRPAPAPSSKPAPAPVVSEPVVVPAPEPVVVPAPEPAPVPVVTPSTSLVPASGGSASFLLEGGRQALLSLDGAALADLGADLSLAIAYDPAPTPPNEAAAGSLGGGNVIPLGRPISLALSLRDAAGQDMAIPASHAARMVDLRLPVLVHPQEPDVQMAWLMEVKDAQGQFLGYMRVPAEFEPATNSLRYQVALGAGQNRLLLPVLIVPAYVRNFDPAVHIWSSPLKDAVDFGLAAEQFTLFKVVGPQVGGRIFVFNPESDNYGWIDAAGVGNVAAPS